MQNERRELRSNDPAEAVRIFLARNATEVGMRAAVVSDPSGTMIGGVGDGELDRLARAGRALLEAHGVADRERLRNESPFDVGELHVARLRVGVRNFVITTLGARLGAVDRLGGVLGRILGA